MSDLLHWDYVNEFTAHEIACLIKGLDPHDIFPCSNQNIRLIVDRINNAYSNALWDAVFHDADKLPEKIKNAYLSQKKLREPQGSLASTRLEEAYERLINYNDEKSFRSFLDEEKYSPKVTPTFRRTTIAKWLIKNNLNSIYPFIKNPSSSETNTYNQSKPLSTKERNTLLAIIATLCQEAKIDYTRPAKAAASIQHTADSMGISIGESTIESHLKKIPDALASRMK